MKINTTNIYLENGWYKNKLFFVYYKCSIMKELTFPKELMLIKQVHQKSVIFVTIGISYSLTFQPNAFNRCHDLLMMPINLSNIAILNIKGSDYCCIISLISINEAIKLM